MCVFPRVYFSKTFTSLAAHRIYIFERKWQAISWNVLVFYWCEIFWGPAAISGMVLFYCAQ